MSKQLIHIYRGISYFKCLPMSTIVVLIAVMFCGGCFQPKFADQNALSQASRGELVYEWKRHYEDSTYRDIIDIRTWGSHTGYRKAIKEEAIRRHDDWTDREKELVRNSNVWIGATFAHIYWAWGPPKDERKERYPGSKIEYWYYGRRPAYGWYSDRIKFHNGKVEWWHIEGR